MPNIFSLLGVSNFNEIETFQPVSQPPEKENYGIIPNIQTNPFKDNYTDTFQPAISLALNDNYAEKIKSQIFPNSNYANGSSKKVVSTDNQAEKTDKTDTEIISIPGKKQLNDEEKRVVNELKKADSRVRAHENAHIAAGGGLVRGKSLSYSKGPDGREYAIGGEVQIDMSPVSDNPDATIQKMQQVKRAALAPVDPSAQDRSVAASADEIAAGARKESTQNKLTDNKPVTLQGFKIKSYSGGNNNNFNQIGSNIDFKSEAPITGELKIRKQLLSIMNIYG
jgi:hypothetical protein